MAHSLSGLLAELGFLPRVESPWPDKIGLGFPIATAGACGVIAGACTARWPVERRDRVTRLGGLFGLSFGFAVYLIALVAQVVSSL